MLARALLCFRQCTTMYLSHHQLLKPLIQAILKVHLGTRISKMTHPTTKRPQLIRAEIPGKSQGGPQQTNNGRQTIKRKWKLGGRGRCPIIRNTNNQMHQEIQQRLFVHHSSLHLAKRSRTSQGHGPLHITQARH